LSELAGSLNLATHKKKHVYNRLIVPINIVRKRHELLYESNKPNYSAVKACFSLRILTGIKSRPFTDGQFIREYLIKIAEVICLEKVK
jgi:hypothetical protein